METDELPTSPAEMHNQRGLDPKTNKSESIKACPFLPNIGLLCWAIHVPDLP